MSTTTVKQNHSISQARTGFFLIMAGGFAFAANQFGFSLNNWWALFIFLPATVFHLIARKAAVGQDGRSLTVSRLFNSLGLIVFVVASMFLINLNWGHWWPLMLLASSVGLFSLGWHHLDSNEHPIGFSFAALSRWIGVTTFLLGITFLLNQRFGLVLNGRLANFPWWGFFPLIIAVGSFFNAWKAFINNQYRINSAVAFLGFTSILFTVSGITELFQMSWESLNNIVGISLVLGGVLIVLANNGRNHNNLKAKG